MLARVWPRAWLKVVRHTLGLKFIDLGSNSADFGLDFADAGRDSAARANYGRPPLPLGNVPKRALHRASGRTSAQPNVESKRGTRPCTQSQHLKLLVWSELGNEWSSLHSALWGIRQFGVPAVLGGPRGGSGAGSSLPPPDGSSKWVSNWGQEGFSVNIYATLCNTPSAPILLPRLGVAKFGHTAWPMLVNFRDTFRRDGSPIRSASAVLAKLGPKWV